MIRGDGTEQAVVAWVGDGALVLGVGNPLRGDDGAGPLVCARVGAGAVDCGDAPERYVGLAGRGGVERVLMVDAVDFGGAPGEVVFCGSGELVERFGTTHDSGLAVLARFIEEEYGKPVAVVGIQPGDTRLGAEVSAAVREAVERVSGWLHGRISDRRPGEVEGAWSCS